LPAVDESLHAPKRPFTPEGTRVSQLGDRGPDKRSMGVGATFGEPERAACR
jgi:hypothetical protein